VNQVEDEEERDVENVVKTGSVFGFFPLCLRYGQSPPGGPT